MQDIERTTPTEIAVYEALATYRYLTTQQMLKLKVSGSERYLYSTLRDLRNRKKRTVGSLDFGAMPTVGRLPILYYLTEHGASILEDYGRAWETIKHPKRVRLFSSDYFHRIRTIDFQIALRQWAEMNSANVDLFNTYFDFGQLKGGRAYPKTRVYWKGGSLVPDALFSFTTEDGKQRLCTFEMHNGGRADRLANQVRQYVEAIHKEAIETVYQYDGAVRVLIVCEKPETQTALQKIMAKENMAKSIKQRFFLKPFYELGNDFVDGWESIDGEKSIRLF